MDVRMRLIASSSKWWMNMKAMSIYLLIRFLSFTYFFFLSFNFISNMKPMTIYLLIHFCHSAISFPFLHFHIEYESDVNLFAYSFLSFSYFFSLPSFSYWIWKRCQSISLFVFSHSPISFSSPSFSYRIWNRCQSISLFISIIQLFLFACLQLHIRYKVESMFCLIHSFLFSYFFFLSFIFILNMKTMSIYLLIHWKWIIEFIFQVYIT